MNIKGIKVIKPKNEFIVFPQRLENGSDLIFEIAPVLDFTKFEELCKRPEPPEVLLPGGLKTTDPDDKRYLEALTEYGKKRTAFMVITALAVTEGFTWDTIDINNPETWKNWQDEFKSNGFSELELIKIFNTVLSVSGLNQDKVDQATENFYKSLANQVKE